MSQIPHSIELLNASRAAHGVGPLKQGWLLTRYAKGRAAWMVRANKLEHGDLGGYLKRVAWTSWGENIGASAEAFHIEALHDAWMASPDHRRNILDPRFKRVGVAYDSAAGITFGCHAFKG